MNMEKLQRALEMSRVSARRDSERSEERLDFVRREPAALGKGVTWKRRVAPLVPAEMSRRHTKLRTGAGRDPASEAYRVVRTQVLQRMNRHGFRSLAIVSAAPDDGKTLTALNLAFAISQDSRHTALVVDLDLRAPSVHTALGLTVDRGLESYFSRQTGLDELIVPVVNERMAVLPCLEPVPAPSEVLASAESQALVGELAARYRDRIILFDLSPVLVGDDVMSFLPYVEAVLVVVGEGVTHKGDLKRVFDVLGNTPVVGTILNRSRDAAIKPYG
jgi:Mrp family chromosome partitioning ATPase